MAEVQTDEQPVNMIEVNWCGKAHMMTEEDAATIRKSIVDRLRPYVDALSKSLKVNAKIHEEYLETAQLKNGFLNAVSQVIVMKVADVALWDSAQKIVLDAAVGAATGAIAGKIDAKLFAPAAAAATEAEAVEALGAMAKSGKVPTESDLMTHFEKFLIASLTGGAGAAVQRHRCTLAPLATHGRTARTEPAV